MSDLYLFKTKPHFNEEKETHVIISICNMETVTVADEGVYFSYKDSEEDLYLYGYDAKEISQLINLANNDEKQQNLLIKSTLPFLNQSENSSPTPSDPVSNAAYISNELDALQVKTHLGLGGNYAFTDVNGFMFDGILHDVSEAGGIFVIPKSDNIKAITKTVVAQSMHYMEGESPKDSEEFLKGGK